MRIISTNRTARPYLTGTVECWPDEGVSAELDSMRRAASLFSQYVAYMLKLTGQEEERVPIPTDADLLSYTIASSMQVAASVRQELLETPGSGARLQREIEMLQNELPLLRSLTENPEPPRVGFGQFSAN